jgi:hypothetical protein
VAVGVGLGLGVRIGVVSAVGSADPADGEAMATGGALGVLEATGEPQAATTIANRNGSIRAAPDPRTVIIVR